MIRVVEQWQMIKSKGGREGKKPSTLPWRLQGGHHLSKLKGWMATANNDEWMNRWVDWWQSFDKDN